MTRTISDLYNGVLRPASRVDRNNPALQESLGFMDRNYQSLESLLSPEQKTALEKYRDAVDEHCFLLGEQSFCDGFSLCARLLSESFHRAEETTQEP